TFLAATVLACGGTSALAQGYGGPYGFGATPSAKEIAAVDIDAMPDGRGLPPGSGTYAESVEVYATQCAACHGEDLQGIPEVGIGGDRLIGGRGSLASGSPAKTIESYWPHATTVFDYVKRAMPFHAPGSLSDDEVYAVTAFILGEADIIGQDDVMNAETLPEVQMPNRDGFVPDPRPDVHNYE
ncbi:MAG: c-type cytochrome, partial [Geminicoccales bacterium]